MPRSPLDSPTTAHLALRSGAPVAGVLAMLSLAAWQRDPMAAAETAYLALAAGAVLVAAAGVAPRSGAHGGLGAALVVTAVWALPAGPARGAAALALAAGTLAVAAFGRRGPAPARELLAPRAAVALAIGLQALLRGGDLLGTGSLLRTAAVFVAFPAVGAAALIVLGRLQGPSRALLAGAALLALGPGFRPATLTALVALAAAPVALGRVPGWTRPGARIAALALLAAPFAWDPRAAGVAAAAGLALALAPGRDPEGEEPGFARSFRGGWAPALVGAAALALAALAPGRGFAESLELAALVPLAVPALALAGGRRWGVALAALALALAAGRAVAVEGALAAAGALAAFALPEPGGSRRPAASVRVRAPVQVQVQVQAVWSCFLLGLTALLSAFPWLRPEPLAAALGLLGLPVTWWSALAVMVAAATLGVAAGVAHGRAGAADRDRPGAPLAGLTAAVVLALLIASLPAAGSPLLAGEALVLDRDQPRWAVELSAAGQAAARMTDGRHFRLVLDSALANAAGLPHGTPVATVRLRSARGPDRVWTLRLGEETEEWAAARPGLALGRPASAVPWLSWVAADGLFFGRRYRTVLRLAAPGRPELLEVALRPDLPPEVALTLFQVEVRP